MIFSGERLGLSSSVEAAISGLDPIRGLLIVSGWVIEVDFFELDLGVAGVLPIEKE